MTFTTNGSGPIQFSAQLGTLAGRLSSGRQARIDSMAQPFTLNSRLLALLESLKRRQQTRETFKANHFIMAD